jgi:outer membrane receptor for ferrienterochelin and colicins
MRVHRASRRGRETLVLALLASSAPALAQAAPASGDPPPPVASEPATVEGAKTYTPADFARFAPRTALDMLNQVPGFVIRQADERRGLGQATSNVLINGERFSGKSNDVVAELSRISASNVVRIEIVDGATLNVPGLSGQVANIVVNASSKLAGTWRWRPQLRARQTPPRVTNGQISLNGSSGRFDYSFSVVNDSFVNGNAGPEVVTDGQGRIIDLRDEILDVAGEQPKISLGLKHRGKGGAIANLNASYQIFHFDADEISLRSFPGQVDRDRRFHEQEREYNYELGGDYEFGLGGGRLKLIGLRRFEHSPYEQQVVTRFADRRPDTGQRFEQIADETESILRGEYGWKMGGADWQIAAEGALNRLDVDSALSELGPDGLFRPLPLDNAVATVKEERAEAMLSYGRPLSRTLTLQTSVGGEYSQLSQTGPNGLTRTFYRPKGFVSLAWKPTPRLDLSAKLSREVGQLNFFDFVAFVNVGGGFGNAGNPELVPQQSWNLDLEATRNLGAWGTSTLKLYGRRYSDVVDIVPIGATGQAVGNLDSASLVGVNWKSTFNLDPIGVKGAKFDVEVQFQRSRIEDPLTGEQRSINSSNKRYINVQYRHDVPRTDWAYGGYYDEFENAFFYRLDIKERPFNDPAGVGLFVEHKDVMGLTIRGSVDNLLGTQEQFTRIFYDGRRTNGILFTEFRDRDYGPIFTLTISGKI